MNAYRAMGLVLLCGFGFGAFSMVLPREPHGARENAPLLEAVYAAPAERVDTHVLRGGENLTKVLGRSGITGTELWDLLLALREHKDPRWLVSGTEVTVRRWAATDELRSIDVRVNADSTVRLARSIIGWSGDLVLAAIYVDTVYIAGTIEAGRTLYEAIAMDDELTLSARERAQVVAQLANDIYAYRLDFSHDIRPGDRYRLVYERERREDGSTRRRRILIAEIENQGRTYSAVHFDLGKAGGGYYDRDGQSLWLAFRRSPLEFSRVTSSFSWNRYHPLLGIYRAHLGTDFGAAYGTPVHATGDGTVAFAARDGGYGNVVVLHHPGGYSTRYAHLGRFAAAVRPGRRVRQGQAIGYVGSSGLATGPHLHYEFRKDGRALNARTVKLPGAPPIPAELMVEFREVTQQRFALLERAVGRGAQVAAASRSGRSLSEGM